MSIKLINGILSILVLALVVILVSSDQSISKIMEHCGAFVSNLFN